MEFKLEKAIEIARRAHKGQKDKAGQDYIQHPFRVMESLSSDTEKITAILHDVIEDSDLTAEDLRKEGVSEEILAALDCLTKRQGEKYGDFIERVKPNPLARVVKLADLKDNMDLTRIPSPTQEDRNRIEKYLRAWARLGGPPLDN